MNSVTKIIHHCGYMAKLEKSIFYSLAFKSHKLSYVINAANRKHGTILYISFLINLQWLEPVNFYNFVPSEHGYTEQNG